MYYQSKYMLFQHLVRFVFISGCFLAEIKDIDFYILVTVVVIVLGEVDTKTFGRFRSQWF